MRPYLVLPILFCAVGLLLIVLAIPLIRRRVGPNPLYGVRLSATFADDWVWYEANARSGYDLLYLGVLVVASALLLPFVGLPPEAYALCMTALLLLGTIIMAVVGWRRANRLLRERQARDRSSP